MTSKERCLAAIQGRPVDRVPAFPLLMSLTASRAGITYRQFASDGSALAEAQLKMRADFPGLGAITACSDGYRSAADMGGELIFPDRTPPTLAEPLVTCAADLDHLRQPDLTRKGGRMADRLAALGIMQRAVGDECLVMGWVEMPFAAACVLCGVTEFMLIMIEDPPLAHRILEFCTQIEIEFAQAQLEIVPAVGAGDAAASLISPEMFREFALPYEQRICSAVHDAGGLIKLHICGNTTALLDDMVGSGADLFNVDHTVDFARARDVYARAGKCFKGNLDPVADFLQATPEHCQRRAVECLDLAAGTPFMLSAGCELPAGTPDEVLRAFCDAPRVVRGNRG